MRAGRLGTHGRHAHKVMITDLRCEAYNRTTYTLDAVCDVPWFRSDCLKSKRFKTANTSIISMQCGSPTERKMYFKRFMERDSMGCIKLLGNVVDRVTTRN